MQATFLFALFTALHLAFFLLFGHAGIFWLGFIGSAAATLPLALGADPLQNVF